MCDDSSPSSSSLYGEKMKEVEHGSITPLVFSTCGGMAQEASVVAKKLADALAMKRSKSYSRVVIWIRCCLAFSLARSASYPLCARISLHAPHDSAAARTPMDLVHDIVFTLNKVQGCSRHCCQCSFSCTSSTRSSAHAHEVPSN